MAMQGPQQAFFSRPKCDKNEQINELYASGRFCVNDIAKQLGISRNSATKNVQTEIPANTSLWVILYILNQS